MVIEVPSKYINNIFFFYKLIEILDKNSSITLFINTIEEKVYEEKLKLCISLLELLKYKINVIIDKEINNYYEAILLQSKISGDLKISEKTINSNIFLYYLESELIKKMDYKKYIFSSDYKEPDLKVYDVNQIIKINSNEENIKIIINILSMYDIDTTDFKDNYYALKLRLIELFKSIKSKKYNNISKNIDLYSKLNLIVNFKEEL